jgi:hypothetical protein
LQASVLRGIFVFETIRLRFLDGFYDSGQLSCARPIVTEKASIYSRVTIAIDILNDFETEDSTKSG